MPSLHAVLELARPMPCHHACNSWACDINAMPSLHAVPKLAGHMPYHHYMQVWSIWGICHALIKCNFRACDTYTTPSAITSYWFTLVYITLYYTILHCILSLIGPMSPKPWCLQGMYHAIIICSPGAKVGICHILLTCSSGACMPSLHAIPEFVAHMPCPHHMQFWSLYGICHTTITCSSRIYTGQMSCHCLMQFRSLWYICHPPGYCFVLLCIALYYFKLLCIILYFIAL